MQNKDLYVFFSTSESTADGTMAKESIDKMIQCGILKEKNWSVHLNNVDSLAKVYNDILNSDAVTNKILLLIHSDVRVDDMFIAEKVNARFNRSPNAVAVGIAGGARIKTDPIDLELWHLMTPRQYWRGEVTNNCNYDILSPVVTTRFGLDSDRVLLIDGCFMALDVDRIRTKGIEFDEKCPSKFNFYDLNFSIRCYWMGGEVYVDPIHIVHKSVGLTRRSVDFDLGNEFFKNNYLSKLN